MRYTRSIRIMKGLRINFSKTGISSISIGTGKNTVKIGGHSSKRPTTYNNKVRLNGINTAQKVLMTFNIRVEDDGTVIIKDEKDRIIKDETLLRKIKRSNEFKEMKAKLMNDLKNQIEEETNQFIEIYKLSAKVPKMSEYKKMLESLKPNTYKKAEFNVPEPDYAAIENEVIAEAKENIKSLAFWNVKSKRNEYINTESKKRIAEAQMEWVQKKKDFEEREEKYSKKINEQYIEEFKNQQKSLKKAICGHYGYIDDNIANWLSSIELPVEFKLEYDHQPQTGSLFIDLDLPEIEDLPKEKVSQLANGTVKRKNKTQKELNYDYVQCVYGLAIFFASHLFAISPMIINIQISGYTQRRNKKTGDIQDDYIYSIKFDRTQFEKQNVANIQPMDLWNKFENRCLPTQTYMLKTIEPFE